VAVDTALISEAKTFSQISAGGSHTCGITTDGVAYCWGLDRWGQLGDGESNQNKQSPEAVDTAPITGTKTFSQISAGEDHTCCTTTVHEPYCWGSDGKGKLGNSGSPNYYTSPVAVDVSSRRK
jgi:alpha-tubulin suppressor-like RCC1 family protein